MKTEMLVVRIEPELKNQSEDVLKRLGLTTSYAIGMFLQQVVYKGEIPFKIALPKNEETKVEELSRLINATGGKENIDPKLEKIIHLFSIGNIDLETAKFAIRRYFVQ